MAKIKRLLLNGYMVAAWATLALAVFLHFLHPIFRGSPPVHLFLVGVMLATWQGGFRAGFLATALSGLATAYLSTEPLLSWQIAEERERLRLLMFVGVGSLTSLTIAMLRRGEQRALREMTRHKKRLEEESATRTQAEEAWRTSEERLLLALRIGRAGAWSWDVASDLAAVSDSYSDLYGFPAGQPVTLGDWLAAVHPEDREFCLAHNKEMLRTGEESRIEFRIVHPERGVRWIDAISRTEFDAQGRPVRVAGINFDITEQKLAKSELKEIQFILSEAQRIAHVGSFEYRAETKTTVWSDEEYRIYGLTPGVPSPAYDDLLASFIHPHDVGLLNETFTAATQSRSIYELEHRIVRPDGSVRVVYDRAHPYFDGKGNLVRYVGATLDITERKRAEETLRASESRLRRFYESGLIGVFYWTIDGSITDANEKFLEMIGYDREELTAGRIDWARMTPPEFRYLDERSLAELRATGVNARPFEKEYIRKDGTRLPIIVAGAMLDEARINGVAFVLDNTARKQTEQALLKADRQKDEFLAMLAHELRNPLAPVLNAAQILRRPGLTDAQFAWCRDVIDRQVAHLTRLVDDLLDVSRISQGKIELRVEPIDVADLVQRAIETSRPLIDGRRHELTVLLPPEPILIEGDMVRLAQVVSNLLNNAAKYTDVGGRIGLSVGCDGAQVAIRVSDTGHGLDPESLSHVFDLFYQTDRTLDRSEGGLGIGLSLVKRLVDLHGGTVQAFSAGRDRGSEFVIRLPCLSHPPATESVAAARAPVNGLSILVVDDNGDAADSLALLLENDGHRVRTAYDGEVGLKMALAEPPEVVLLDIGLPGLDGYAVARALRRSTETKGCWLIALTGYGQAEGLEKSLAAGFDRHLVKPIDFEALRGALAEHRVRGG